MAIVYQNVFPTSRRPPGIRKGVQPVVVGPISKWISVLTVGAVRVHGASG
jgi:hypothetical protein